MGCMLISWIGNNDILAGRGGNVSGLGAIGDFLTVKDFDEILLLHNRSEDAEQYRAWLENESGVGVSLAYVNLPVPYDFDSVYDRTRDAILEFLTSRTGFQGSRPAYLLSSGTKAMSSALFLIACSDLPGKIYFNWKEGEASPEGPANRVIRVRWPERFSLSLFASRRPLLAGEGVVQDADGRELSRSPLMREVYRRALRVAPTGEPVLLLGESGTGKEILARKIHAESGRSGNFVAINCGAIPPEIIDSELFGHQKGAFTGAARDHLGQIRDADQGTLFLDEIAELPESAQIRLLRVLQEKEVTPVGGIKPVPVDVRIIAATHKPIRQMARDGDFRQDVYFRLAGYLLQLPSLRARVGVGDLELIAAEYLKSPDGAELLEVDEAAWRELKSYQWPGNVREFQNVIRRCCVDAGGHPKRKIISGALVRSVLREQGLSLGQGGIENSLPTESPAFSPGLADSGRWLLGLIKSSGVNLSEALDQLECATVQAAIAIEGKNKDAAGALGISPQNLSNKKKEWSRKGLWG